MRLRRVVKKYMSQIKAIPSLGMVMVGQKSITVELGLV